MNNAAWACRCLFYDTLLLFHHVFNVDRCATHLHNLCHEAGDYNIFYAAFVL